jgi:hypothetical protein
MGRWPSPDPAGISSVSAKNPQTWNRYAYVGNNPLVATDPTGMVASYACAGPPCGPSRSTGGNEGGGSGLIDDAMGGDSFAFANEQQQVQEFAVQDAAAAPSTASATDLPPCSIVLVSCAAQLNLQGATYSMFGVVTLLFTPSQIGVNGSFFGLDLNNTEFDPGNGFFSVTNDVTAQGCVGCDAGDTYPNNLISSNGSYQNFSNNTIVDPDLLNQVQVWELGNTLALATGASPLYINQTFGDPGYNEPGYFFLQSVYGAYASHALS